MYTQYLVDTDYTAAAALVESPRHTHTHTTLSAAAAVGRIPGIYNVFFQNLFLDNAFPRAERAEVRADEHGSIWNGGARGVMEP